MDPRRPSLGAHDPRKRQLSRSPEGAHARKQFKPDQEKTLGPIKTGDSPRSSISNDAPRQNSSGAVPQSLHTRRQSFQPDKGPRKEDEGASSSDSNAILDSLITFSSQVASHAYLHMSKEQAAARVQRAQLEYNMNRKQFTMFPSIRESKEAEKVAAQKELNDKEHKLNEHNASQHELMGTLANLIGQATEVQPRTDVVSREEFESLQASHNKLKSEADATIKGLRFELAEAKRLADKVSSQAGQVPGFASQIKGLRSDANYLLEWKPEAQKALVETKKLEVNMQNAASTSEAARKDIAHIRNVELKSHVTKKDQDELNTKYERLAQKVAGVEKKNTEIAKEVDHVKSDKAASSTTTPLPTNGNAVGKELKAKIESLLEAGPTIISTVEELKVKVNDLYAFTKGVDEEDLDSPVDDHSSLNKRLYHIDQQINQASTSINRIMAEITEEGKEVVVKRFKNLDRVVSDLSSQLSGDKKLLISQRLSQLEQDQNALQNDLKNIMTDPQPQAGATTSVDLGPLKESLKNLQDEFKSFSQQQEEKDDMLDGFMDEKVQPLREQITIVGRSREEHVQRHNAFFEDAKQNIENCFAILNTKVTAAALEPLNSDVQGLKDDIKKLQTQQQRASASTTTLPPGLPQLPTQSPQLPNGAVNSPQLPNGFAGPPQNQNAAPSPRTNSPHGHPVAQTPSNMAQELKKLHERMDAVMGAQQQPNLSQELKNLQDRVDAVIGAQQQLKQRCDNLQTDDIARQMLDQMAHMYPNAKNVDMNVRDVRQSLRALSNQIQKMQKDRDNQLGSLTADVADAKSALAKATKIANDGEALARDMEILKGEVGVLRGKAKNGGISTNGVSNTADMRAFQEEIDQVSKMAAEAERLSKVHASRFSKLNPEKMKEKLDETQKDIIEIRCKVNKLEKGFESGETELKNVRSDIDVLKEEIVTGSGKIESLEKSFK